MDNLGMLLKGYYTGCKESASRETGIVSYRYGVSDGAGGHWSVKSDDDIKDKYVFGDEIAFVIDKVNAFNGQVYFGGSLIDA